MIANPPPLCLIIAGPNGAGKTTFARQLLPRAGISDFINVDLIALGLAPLHPQTMQIQATRLFFQEFDRLSSAKASFAFESTLSGRSYLGRIQALKEQGYHIQICYLKVDAVKLSLQRVAHRVRQGGHDVPAEDIRRRFIKSWSNFNDLYRPLADTVYVFDNSTSTLTLLESYP